MKRMNSLAALMIAASLASACGPKLLTQSHPPLSQSHSDSGIRGPRHSQLLAAWDGLAASYPKQAKLIRYGKSVDGRDLAAVRIQDETASAPSGQRLGVIITGSIHGDEFLNIEDRLAEAFLQDGSTQRGFQQFLKAGGVVYVVPIINPDGYEARNRENSTGQDLNRDFDLKRANKSGFGQPETKNLASFLKSDSAASGVNIRFTFDYHCCIGGLIYPWGYSTTDKAPEKDLNKFRQVGQQVESLFGYSHGTAMEVVNYTALGASDDFFYETFGGLSFTFEGSYGQESKNLPKHLTMWDQFFLSLLKDSGAQTPPSVSASDLFVKIGDSTDQGATIWAATADQQIGSEFCLGDLPTCQGSAAKWERLVEKSSSAGRKFYKSNALVTLTRDQTVSFALSQSNGSRTGIKTVRILHK